MCTIEIKIVYSWLCVRPHLIYFLYVMLKRILHIILVALELASATGAAGSPFF